MGTRGTNFPKPLSGAAELTIKKHFRYGHLFFREVEAPLCARMVKRKYEKFHDSKGLQETPKHWVQSQETSAQRPAPRKSPAKLNKSQHCAGLDLEDCRPAADSEQPELAVNAQAQTPGGPDSRKVSMLDGLKEAVDHLGLCSPHPLPTNITNSGAGKAGACLADNLTGLLQQILQHSACMANSQVALAALTSVKWAWALKCGKSYEFLKIWHHVLDGISMLLEADKDALAAHVLQGAVINPADTRDHGMSAQGSASLGQLYTQSFTAGFANDLEMMNAASSGPTGPMRIQLIAYSIEAGLQAIKHHIGCHGYHNQGKWELGHAQSVLDLAKAMLNAPTTEFCRILVQLCCQALARKDGLNGKFRNKQATRV
ncbi:hypothetical protein WJX74_006758 [Apatococcus lobatus]|uniref:Uncharacterized protein n=1 Tax=Apatococcus lobatus TaxID=904363 RepID=A0AAW1RE20_9CHLO